ncbi:hypothetical protein [Weissella oryzae]|uniref:hypothetical protein n=1 Tax=Weissella oryzae TaxID=1129792 RepID=UPI0011A74118|nr:hypothetical protein [Weissella oryzae]
MVILVLVVGFGVKKHMDNETIKHNVIVNEQKIAKKLISEYDGIKKIEFTRVSSDEAMGQYELRVNDDKVSLGYNNYGQGVDKGRFADGDDVIEETSLSNAMKRDKRIPVKDINLDKYNVIYYTTVD